MINAESAGAGIYMRANGHLCMQYYTDNSWKNYSSDYTLKEGEVYTVVITYDNKALKIYVNGKLIKTENTEGNIKTSSMPLTLGANPNSTGPSKLTNFDLFETAIYNRAITDSEISSDSVSIMNKDKLLKYLNFGNKTFSNNAIIPENVIESYFVWIPKYKYRLWDLGNYDSPIESNNDKSNAREIEIVFSKDNTKDIEGYSCKTPLESGSSGECNVGEWMTHPAFINFDVNGFWVGKFETGYKGATTPTESQINASDPSKVIIKPNVYSWRNSIISNMFKTAYNYKRNLDSHLMKNTEWAAVAYLSHSKYGINQEIRINNNTDFITGYAAAEGTNQSIFPGDAGNTSALTVPYNTVTGYKASTTGNITGIYDMAGGAWEYMASYIPYSSDASGFSASELNEYAKYFDQYSSNQGLVEWNKRILGDATGEVGPFYRYADGDNGVRIHNSWYGDTSSLVDPITSWMIRGGHFRDAVLAGQFHFNKRTGINDRLYSSRLVLSPSI